MALATVAPAFQTLITTEMGGAEGSCSAGLFKSFGFTARRRLILVLAGVQGLHRRRSSEGSRPAPRPRRPPPSRCQFDSPGEGLRGSQSKRCRQFQFRMAIRPKAADSSADLCSCRDLWLPWRRCLKSSPHCRWISLLRRPEYCTARQYRCLRRTAGFPSRRN